MYSHRSIRLPITSLGSLAAVSNSRCSMASVALPGSFKPEVRTRSQPRGSGREPCQDRATQPPGGPKRRQLGHEATGHSQAIGGLAGAQRYPEPDCRVRAQRCSQRQGALDCRHLSGSHERGQRDGCGIGAYQTGERHGGKYSTTAETFTENRRD